jgi:hypothetical protein
MHRSSLPWPLILLLVSPACGPMAGERPYLALEPEAIHLPGALEGRTVAAPLDLFNLGSEVLLVESIRLSPDGTFTVVGPEPPFSIEPEGTMTLQVRHTPSDRGCDSATLRIASNDLHRPLATVQISALPSAPVLVATPMALDFGPTPSGATRTQEVQLRNLGRAAARNMNLVWLTPHEDFSASIPVVHLDPGGSMTLTVSYTPRGGDSDQALLLLSFEGGGQQIPLSGSQDLKAPF